jgi:starch synthase
MQTGTSETAFCSKTTMPAGLYWAVTQAMKFFSMPKTRKRRQIERIMQESAATFNHANTARQYIDLYEKMLERPLIN